MATSIQQYLNAIPDKRIAAAVTNAFRRLIGSKADASVNSSIVLKPTRLITAEGTPTSEAAAAGATISAAEILAGIYVRDCTGAGRTDTFDTAANIVAAIPDAAVGDVLRLYIVNGSDAAESITLAAGSGGGFDANQIAASRIIAQNNSKLVHIRLTNVTAGSEAYVIYA